jgi:Protein of unknown function (DUF3313)
MKIRITAFVPAAMLLAGFAWGCTQTVQSQPSSIKSGRVGAAVSGFFGPDASLLQPGGPGKAAMVYINPNAQWAQYKKILLEPVQFWDSQNSTVSPSDQQMLTAYFYNRIRENLQKNFTLVDHGGPGVLDIQVALVNASAATPGLRTVSVVVPQARLLNRIQSLASGSLAFVGSAEAATKITDSADGQLLAAAIDKRAGGMALSSAAQWKWGDAENAMDYWAKRASDRLLELQGRASATR